jgi:putative pyruvate formate lyase activating enzyme
VFCQNWKIAHRGDGTYISARRLARLMMKLQRRGCHNINLVTPTHQLPQIIRALRLAIPMGLNLPLVYNTGGYDHPKVIKLLDGIIDIYLPDFKYTDDRMGLLYSSAAHDYPQVARTIIKEMHRQTGYLRQPRGIAQRGLMIRHLVMPNNIAGTDRFVRWVAAELSRYTYVNLMGQYRPEHWAFNFPELSRRLTVQEMRKAVSWAEQAGLKKFEV